jgi:hypothetical protein
VLTDLPVTALAGAEALGSHRGLTVTGGDGDHAEGTAIIDGEVWHDRIVAGTR